MGGNDSKRQKRLAKKKKKRQEKKTFIAKQETLQDLPQLRRKGGADSFPLGLCLVSREIFRSGKGTVIFTRQLTPGSNAVGMFLVDGWCLGIKDAFLKKMAPSQLNEIIRECRENEDLQTVSPEYARKLVEDVVEFAAGIGFTPHEEYRDACLVFGSVDPYECDKEFIFGDEGVPHFVAGPHDSPTKCKRIGLTLNETRGEGNFYLTLPFGDTFDDFDDDDFDDDEFDDDEFEDDDDDMSYIEDESDEQY